MRSSATSWTSRSNRDTNSTTVGQGHQYINSRLTPTQNSPRNLPLPSFQRTSTLSKSASTLKLGLQSVFRSPLSRAPSVKSTTSSNASHTSHSFAIMPSAPLPVVSSNDLLEPEDECPVCLEPLSFSFRLPGEKPHIVPECGHALHEACFSAVYGPPPGASKSSMPRKTNLGVCGVCRRPMKVGDGDTSKKSNKLAALTGMGDRHAVPLYPGRDTPASRQRAPVAPPYDPTEDDALDLITSVRGAPNEPTKYIVSPSIQVRPEFSSLTRTGDPSQPLTCIVVIELPGKRGANVPGPAPQENYGVRNNRMTQNTNMTDSPRQNGGANLNRYDTTTSTQSSIPRGNLQNGRGHDPLPAFQEYPDNDVPEEDDPFSAITEDLRSRIIDWKGHPLSDLGPLQMYDLVSVRRDSQVREFFVYLFKEAIICVVEEKKGRSLGRLFDGTSTHGSVSSQTKGVLRLKGRIYVRHIKKVIASSAAGEMSLTIDMEDELASFILIFKERQALDAWKNQIQSLVNMFQNQGGRPQPIQAPSREPSTNGHGNLDMEEFGGSSKAARMLSGSTGTTASAVDSLLNPGSTRSTLSSSTSHGSLARQAVGQQTLATLGEDDEMGSSYNDDGNMNPHTSLVTPYMSAGPSNSLTPLVHPPLDLILVISVPPTNAVASTAALKVRVIKATLDFIVASLGPRDRLSLVTFEVGTGGRVRKTPFLCPGKPQSMQRLVKFIDETGVREEGFEDEFLVRGSKDEKTDVVTAVNHGLDVVLQRKAKNPVSGMVLVSDASDSTRRAQMDLVLARAEAGNVPIHSFGYGRSHDPASLWLMSNHTSGTYTFVKDWYDLRDCVAGCVGGMMSIGLANMKLHLKVVDSHRFRIRKVSGGPASILASDGQNVDIDVGELRYGERKEMLIELELDNADVRRMASRNNGRHMNATDQFVQSMGLDSLTIDDGTDLVDGMMDRMIDEVPVVEVDGSFFDPAASKQVSRLAHPVLLTITLLPMSASSPRSPSNPVSDPVIVRRRMELLASDMITRALVLVSRKNYPQAQKIMNETKRILHTVLQSLSRSLPPSQGQNTGSMRNRKEIMTMSTVRAMQAILQDLQVLSEALDDNVELFAHDQRNFGAQQAMILRDQKSWSGRSATERLFWTTDNSIELVARSTDWVARDS